MSEKKTLPFNVNHYVRVKLNDLGREALKRDHAEFWASVRGRSSGVPEYTPPDEDADGWSKWQLWSLMDSFGSHMSLGARVPFDTEILFEVEEPDVE